MILRLPPEMDLQFYFSNVPSDSNWNRLVLIKNEISARNQWNPRRTDGELFEPSETWWIKTLQFLLEKSLPNCRSENERNILLCSSQTSEIAECWSTHHLEWFHLKIYSGLDFWTDRVWAFYTLKSAIFTDQRTLQPYRRFSSRIMNPKIQ